MGVVVVTVILTALFIMAAIRGRSMTAEENRIKAQAEANQQHQTKIRLQNCALALRTLFPNEKVQVIGETMLSLKSPLKISGAKKIGTLTITGWREYSHTLKSAHYQIRVNVEVVGKTFEEEKRRVPDSYEELHSELKSLIETLSARGDVQKTILSTYY